VGILSDQRIQPGEKVLTAGGDQIFPRGLPVGVVEKVVRDPDRDSFIDVIVKPAAHLDRLDEVLVITSTLPRWSPEQQQDLAASEAIKGAEAEAIKEQKKASEIMAERLPGLSGRERAGAHSRWPTRPPRRRDRAGPMQRRPRRSGRRKLLHAQHSRPVLSRSGAANRPRIETNDKPPRQNEERSAPEGEENRSAPQAESKPGQEASPRRNR